MKIVPTFIINKLKFLNQQDSMVRQRVYMEDNNVLIHTNKLAFEEYSHQHYVKKTQGCQVLFMRKFMVIVNYSG